MLHFASADPFNEIVPHALPGSSAFWTALSGAVELLLAVGIIAPRTRRVAATSAAIFLVLVFPANVQMAVDWASKPTGDFVVALAATAVADPTYLVGLARSQPFSTGSDAVELQHPDRVAAQHLVGDLVVEAGEHLLDVLAFEFGHVVSVCG